MLYTTFLVSLYFDSDPPTWSKVWTFPLTESSGYSKCGTFQTVWEHLLCTTTLCIILSKVSRTQKLSFTECRVLDKNQGNTTLYRLRTLLATFLKRSKFNRVQSWWTILQPSLKKKTNQQYSINLETQTLVHLLHAWVWGTNFYFNMQI